MAITWPSREDLIERFLDAYKTFFPNAVKSKGSEPWREAQAWGGVAGILVSRMKQIYADMFITTATGAALDVHAEINLPPDKRRQAASGTTAGTVTATGVATAIPLGTELVNAAGYSYRTSESIAVGDWAAGSVTIDVESVDTGQACNMLAAETLDFTSPIAGVDSQVTVATDLTGATDEESDDELRARLLSWKQYPPGGGNYGHYKNYAEGVGGCEKAYVYPHFRGDGTVDVVVLGPGVDDDNPTGDRFTVDEDAVWTELDTEMRPCTADIGTMPGAGGTGVDVAVAQAQPLDIAVSENEGYEKDWAGAFTMTAIDLATMKQITVTADPTATIADDDRILVNVQVGTVWTPCVRTVASTVAGPPHYVNVTEALPSNTPDVVANGLKPAGAGTEEQLEAIMGVFDRLTPGDTIPATRRPVPSSTHPTSLYLADIFDAVQSCTSVQNMTITTPGGDINPGSAKYLIRNGKVYIQ